MESDMPNDMYLVKHGYSFGRLTKLIVYHDSAVLVGQIWELGIEDELLLEKELIFLDLMAAMAFVDTVSPWGDGLGEWRGYQTPDEIAFEIFQAKHLKQLLGEPIQQ